MNFIEEIGGDLPTAATPSKAGGFMVTFHGFPVRFIETPGRWGAGRQSIEVCDASRATMFDSENAARAAVLKIDALCHAPDQVIIEEPKP